MNDWITQALKDRVERQLAQPEVTEALRAQRVAREMITKEFSQLHQTDVLEHIKELGYSQPQQG